MKISIPKNGDQQIWMRQLFDAESSTYTYLLADPQTNQAILIDSVQEKVPRDLKILQDLNLQLIYILETHVHADHITGAWALKEGTGGLAKIALSDQSGAKNADLYLKDGEVVIVGSLTIKAIHTPGHTNGCVTYFTHGRLFTGDTLMIRGCGRTDFQQGNSHSLFESVRKKIFSFPDETLIYPGHDYNGHTISTVGEEKLYNPRLKIENSQDQFVDIMGKLNLAYPKKIDVAVPANLQCGRTSTQPTT